jgi:hypothetical protein
MSEENSKPFPGAWQPFTFGGVAAFANANLARIIILKTLVALIASIVVVWFVHENYFPSVSEALKNFPESAALQNGILTNAPSRILTEKKFLSAIIDLEETGHSGQTADVQVELRRNYFQVCSLFGCALFDYPPEAISLGRSSSEPWWGARQPVILVLCAASVFVALWIAWIIFSCIYAPIAKLLAYFGDRELSWRGSWRLAGAAQMTGALLMSLAIFLYGIQAFDLIRFLFFFALHFVVAWIYVGAAPFFLPRTTPKISVTANPFSKE